jgi:hypothetical protein
MLGSASREKGIRLPNFLPSVLFLGQLISVPLRPGKIYRCGASEAPVRPSALRGSIKYALPYIHRQATSQGIVCIGFANCPFKEP